MKGGSFLNNWRMAQIHAMESPDRVRELEQWGALFDRTRDGRILQRAFGGHTYKRLAHVGDRTGLEMIRTLQDRVVQMPNVKVYMECTVTRLLKDGPRIAGAFAYWRPSGEFAMFRARRRARDRRRRQGLSRHVELVGVHGATARRWRSTRAPS